MCFVGSINCLSYFGFCGGLKCYKFLFFSKGENRSLGISISLYLELILLLDGLFFSFFSFYFMKFISNLSFY